MYFIERDIKRQGKLGNLQYPWGSQQSALRFSSLAPHNIHASLITWFSSFFLLVLYYHWNLVYNCVLALPFFTLETDIWCIFFAILRDYLYLYTRLLHKVKLRIYIYTYLIRFIMCNVHNVAIVIDFMANWLLIYLHTMPWFIDILHYFIVVIYWFWGTCTAYNPTGFKCF